MQKLRRKQVSQAITRYRTPLGLVGWEFQVQTGTLGEMVSQEPGGEHYNALAITKIDVGRKFAIVKVAADWPFEDTSTLNPSLEFTVAHELWHVVLEELGWKFLKPEEEQVKWELMERMCDRVARVLTADA